MRIKGLLLLLLILLYVLCTVSIISGIYNSSQDERLALQKLISLPYINFNEQADLPEGVTLYDRNLTYDGYTVIDGSSIIDMDGKLMLNLSDYPLSRIDGKYIFTSLELESLSKYSLKGSLIWQASGQFHNDFRPSSSETVLAISRELKSFNGRQTYFDTLLRFDKDGKEIWKWSTFDSLEDIHRYHPMTPLDSYDLPMEEFGQRWEKKEDNNSSLVYEYYHMNSIRELPKTKLGDQDKRFQEGNLLMSFRHINLVCILDKETKKAVWCFGPGVLQGQHDVTMLGNGNILIFDNGRSTNDEISRNYSRILEVDPVSNSVVWEYSASPKKGFYTAERGTAQRLPNGNTLIAESLSSRAFEVTKDKKIVWEYYRHPISKGKIKTFISAERIDKAAFERILAGLGENGTFISET